MPGSSTNGAGPTSRAAKTRVSALAKELGLPSREVLAKLTEIGEYVKSASSSVTVEVADRVRKSYQRPSIGSGSQSPASLEFSAQDPGDESPDETLVQVTPRDDRGDSTESVNRQSDEPLWRRRTRARGSAEPPARLREERTEPQQGDEPIASADPDMPTLIRLAFDAARASGRSDWFEMRTAVLKNRLLDITNRRFDEGAYGAANMLEFAKGYPDILEIVEGPGQRRVRFKDHLSAVTPNSAPIEESAAEPSLPRVRSDLWRAVIDFRSGRTYVWDLAEGIARPGRPSSGALSMPTATTNEVHQWRTAFAQQLTELSPGEHAGVDTWLTGDLGTMALPPRLRGQWNGFARGMVLDRIGDFFEEAGLPAPDDLVQHPGSPISHRRDVSGELGSLRSLVAECVAVMTADELRRVVLEPVVVLRALGRRRE